MDKEPKVDHRDVVRLIDEFKEIPKDADPIDRAEAVLPILDRFAGRQEVIDQEDHSLKVNLVQAFNHGLQKLFIDRNSDRLEGLLEHQEWISCLSPKHSDNGEPYYNYISYHILIGSTPEYDQDEKFDFFGDKSIVRKMINKFEELKDEQEN